MERDLIEISGDDDDDDSILCLLPPQSPNAAVSTTTAATFDFSCSPLVPIPRSTLSLSASPLLSSSIANTSDGTRKDGGEDGVMNKENVNVSRAESAKLSINPYQMKRNKRKGGGFNLRKSLAWDRAFFTEQGVLDPMELSMLSGDLSVIHEGKEEESMSTDLQSLDHNLFKELPSNVLDKGGKISGILSRKPGSSATISGMNRKVLSPHDINRSSSKRSGCPRPVASSKRSDCPRPVASPSSSSSLKRPPIVNTTKMATKGPKLSKLSASKPDHPSVVSSTSRSFKTSATNSKHNQIPQPVANAKKNVGLKATSTITKSGVNDVRSGPPGKSVSRSTVQQARRNVVQLSSVPGSQSSTDVKDLPVSQQNSGKQPIPPAAGAAYQPNERDGCASRIPLSFSQSSCTASGNTQTSKPQAAKPSGLRMPSPSLGFFGQSKPVCSQSHILRSTQPSNLSESGYHLSRAGAPSKMQPKPPLPSRKIPVISSAGCSVAPILNSAPHGKRKSNLESSTMLDVEEQVPYNYQNQQQSDINCNVDVGAQCLGNAKPAEPCKLEKISCAKDTSPQKNDELLLLGNAGEQLKENDDNKRATNAGLNSRDLTEAGSHQLSFTSDINLPVVVKAPSETNNMNCNQNLKDRQPVNMHDGVEGASEVHMDRLGSMCDVNQQSGEEAKPMKPDSSEVYPISDMERQTTLINNSILLQDGRYSDEADKHESLNAADGSLEVQICGTRQLETSYSPPHCDEIDHTIDFASGIDNLSKALHARDVQVPCVDHNLMDENDESVLSISAADNPHMMAIDHLSGKSAREGGFQYSCVASNAIEQGKSLSFEDYRDRNIYQTAKSVVSERAETCECELNSDGAACSSASLEQDSGLEVAGIVEYPIAENATNASVENEQVVKSRLDPKLRCEARSLELERMDEGRATSAATICNFELSNVCPNGEVLCVREPENLQISLQFSPVLVKDVAWESKVPCNDYSRNECMDNRNLPFVEQVKLIDSGFHEAEQGHKNQEAYVDLMFDESRSFEDSCKADYESIADIHAAGGNVLRSSNDGAVQRNITEEADEITGVNDMIKERSMTDFEEQRLDGTLLADSYDISFKIPVENNNYLIIDDGIHKQPEERPGLQNPDNTSEKISRENHGSSLDKNLCPKNIFSAESQEGDIPMDVQKAVSEHCQGHSSESKTYNASVEQPSALQNAGLEMDRMAEHLFVDDTISDSVEIESFVTNNECIVVGSYGNGDKQSSQASPVSNSPKNSRHQSPMTGNSNSDQGIGTSCEGILPQYLEVNLPEHNVLPEEAENFTLQNGSNQSELKPELEKVTEDNDTALSLKEPVNEEKRNSVAIKPPPNAAPFSDEWLAAFEAAGEEILTKKGGAVQNSPPDKSLPEPSPWSPVRRKNNQGIGPYDCTKFTNTGISPPTSDSGESIER